MKKKLPKKYKPTKNEKFMNVKMKEYFRQKLLKWKGDLLKESYETISNLKQSENLNQPDVADRASLENEKNLELKTRDRERKLINKIAISIELIKQDEYGWCESCGDEIGIKRLEARPTATHCIDCKTLDEIKEKQLSG